MNPKQGKPARIFTKVLKQNVNKEANDKKGKEAPSEPEKQIDALKLVKPMEKKQISKPLSNYGTFISQALS